MLREVAARQAYQRFEAPQSSLESHDFAESTSGSEAVGLAATHPGSSPSEFIYVADNFKVQTGAKLTENFFVGKPLGCGLQVQVVLLGYAPAVSGFF